MCAAITSAAISVGMAGMQIANAEKQKSDAEKAIKNFKRQELVNPYENIQISTLKSDQQTEANLVNASTSVEALRRGGTRAVLGGIPKVNENNILLQNMISADIDAKDKERQKLIANGEAEIRNIQEGRETRALAGLGQSLQTARQDSASGIGNLITSGLTLGDSLATSETETSTSSSNLFGTLDEEDYSLNLPTFGSSFGFSNDN